MSEIELKPCPFCGSYPEFHEASQISETWFVASVNCRSCCAQVVSQGMETKTAEMANESAIAAWNKRVIDRDELLKIADELETEFFVVYDSYVEIEDHADCFVERIRKAIGE